MDIINELRLRGYDAELISYNKNGVDKKGIIIKGASISPIFDIEHGFTADEIIDYYNQGKYHGLSKDQDMRGYFTEEYIMQHIQIKFEQAARNYSGIVRQSTYTGLLERLYINCTHFSIRVTENVLNNIDMSVQEAWYIAARNTKDKIQIRPFPLQLPIDTVKLAIITNSSFTYGAACALNKRAIVDFARKHGFKNITLIPSSVHEFLLVDLGKEHYDSLLDIVKTVNKEIEPEEFLSNTVYSLN